MPPSGTSLGAAQGSITINTSQLQQAQAHVAAASAAMTSSMNNINASTRRAEASFSDLARAVGISMSVAQIGRFAIEADRVATSYLRQSVAARNLAGSQEQLNALLEAYGVATGGAIDKASSLSNVTKLMAVGFADSVQELDQFARAIRGISIAMGMEQDTATQNLILELFTQRGMRLDQLGLQYDKVRARADELRAADKSLTEAQAYQNAVLEQAIERFGGLADSAAGQKTSMEELANAWKDFRLEVGLTGSVDFVAEAMTNWLKDVKSDLDIVRGAVEQLEIAFDHLRFSMGFRNNMDFPTVAPPAWMTSVSRAASGPLKPVADVAQAKARNEAINDWARDVSAIERQASADRLDATRQFEQQRSSTIRQYGQTIAREAQDFATQRQRAESDLAKSIADIHSDRARQELRMAEDLARTIGDARRDSAERLADMQEDLERTLGERRADSAERVAEWEADRSEAVAEKRKASNDRLLEIEIDYTRERERAERDHKERIEDAAARLDARAVYEENNRFKREKDDQLAARDEMVSEEKTQLQEAIDQLAEAHDERLADEKKAFDKANKQANDAYSRQVKDEKDALDERIGQANDAHARQLEDAKAADEQRILDMQEDLAERIGIEDADRATRLGRMAADHTDQLAEMNTAHGLRLTQINTHARQERKELDDAFDARMLELGIHNAALEAKQTRHEADSLKQYTDYVAAKDKIIDDILKGLGGSHPSEADPYLNRPLPGSTQPGVNPNGPGAAPVQPSPLPSAAALYSYPIPPAVAAASMATGTGGGSGGSSVSIGNINVYGAPTDSPYDFAQKIRKELLSAIKDAAKGY